MDTRLFKSSPSWVVSGCAVLVLSALFTLACILHSKEGSVIINWTTTHQTIDGFGASATGYSDTFMPEIADRFFDPKTGLGLSLLRIRAIPDTRAADCDCVSNSDPHECVTGSKSQVLSGDLKVAKLAAARGATLFASPWSPPAEMKSSGKYCAGGSLIGSSANYTKYAAELASFPVLLQANGLSIVAMSIQNEPEIQNDVYDTCHWTGQQIHDFVPYLYKALNAVAFGHIKIGLPEEATWNFDLMSKAMSDSRVAQRVSLLFGHAYASEQPSSVPLVDGRHVWQTEVGDAEPYDGSMRDGILWARYIHNYMSAGVNAWMYWSLDCGARYFNHDNNMCLTDPKSALAKRAYVLGQYSKFVRPGWQRVDVTNSGNLLVTAYRGPHHEFAIVAINTSRRVVPEQAFTLNGITCRRSQVIPWITSAETSLSPAAPITASSEGTTLTYTIPPESVVTLAGQAD